MTSLVLAAGRGIRSVDRVVIAILLLVAGLGLLSPPQMVASVDFAAWALLGILPYIAASVLIAAGAKATGLDGQVAAVFHGNPARAIMLAALFGALSPMCSCGVVPIIAGLLVAGVPLAPVMAFWIASPLMSPEKFLVMLREWPQDLTFALLFGAIAMGLFAGFATHFLAARGRMAQPLRPDAGIGCGGASALAGGTAGDAPVVWRFWHDADRRGAFVATGTESSLFLLKWLALAFLIERLMIAFIPADTIGQWLGDGSWWAIPASVLVGIPTYLNGFAAIPTVAALLGMGMQPGAALGFMLAGAVTSIPAAMAVYALVRRPVFLCYVSFGLFGSLAISYAYAAFLLV